MSGMNSGGVFQLAKLVEKERHKHRKMIGGMDVADASPMARFLADHERNVGTPSNPAEVTNPKQASVYNPSPFDTNVIIIMAALLCVLVCALGINSLVRCMLRCGRRMAFESVEEAAVRRSNTGLKKRIVKSLPTVIYGNEKSTSSECPICLGDFVEGESLRVLPECKHDFHVKCIDTWLASHSSCPTCRNNLMGASVTDSKVRRSSTELQLVIPSQASGTITTTTTSVFNFRLVAAPSPTFPPRPHYVRDSPSTDSTLRLQQVPPPTDTTLQFQAPLLLNPTTAIANSSVSFPTSVAPLQ